MFNFRRLIQALIKGQYKQVLMDAQLRVTAMFSVSGLVFAGMAFFSIPEVMQLLSKPPQTPALKAALQEIHESKILFNPPHEMDQGKPVRVEARISYQDIGNAISKNLKGPGEITVERIEVGKKMSVTLTSDDEAFKIKKYGSDEQLVAGRPYAQWEWDVTPLQYGEHQLHLKAVINLDTIGNNSTSYDIPVIDKAISVKVNPAFVAEQAARNKEIRDLLIGSGSLLGVIGFIYAGIKAWGKRKKKKEEEEKGRPWETVSDSEQDKH
jgi:hypothetical protein